MTATLDLVTIGAGYVGMPLMEAAVEAGLSVVAFDINTRVIEGLNAGHSHIDDLSDESLQAMLAKGFRASSDPSVLATAKTIVICVPTPLTTEGGPDLGAVIGATKAVAANLQPGQTIILESTTYPGTTDEIVRPILEANGLVAGKDFHLAFSPERVDPGNPTYGIRNTPKVIGGDTPGCTKAAVEFYGQFIETTVPVVGTREAEMAKLLENTYRHINIALVNEMVKFSKELGIDLWNVIQAASTKPFGFQAFYPGPGVGGHCIPIDPNYLSHRVRAELGYPFRFVELAEEINAGMPDYVVRRAMDILNEDGKPMRGAKILLLGVTYKPNISDQRESPAQPLARKLLDKGAELEYHDPHVEDWVIDGQSIARADDLTARLIDADLVIMLQPHRAYDLNVIATATRLFDTKGVVPGDRVVRL